MPTTYYDTSDFTIRISLEDSVLSITANRIIKPSEVRKFAYNAYFAPFTKAYNIKTTSVQKVVSDMSSTGISISPQKLTEIVYLLGGH